ncbi:MAG: ATP-dependent DNA helicase RecG [Candidatus Margulisiibacteriota bacterium]
MLLSLNEAASHRLISNILTASQQSLMVKQKFNHPFAYLFLKPQRYVLRQYSIFSNHFEPNQIHAFVGKLRSVSKKRIRRNLMVFNALLRTESQDIPVVWFNQAYLVEKLKNDPWVVAVGKFDSNQLTLSFQVNQFELYSSLNLTGHGTVLPIYPDIRGVSNRILISIVKGLLANGELQDHLPGSILKAEGLVGIQTAIQYFHFPETQSQVALAMKRFAFDELLMYLFPRRSRYIETKTLKASYSIHPKAALIDQYLAQLPYQLTSAQQRVWGHIADDLTASKTVFRLIQGDVGSGKTDVAILSLLAAISSGLKAAILVPTEILATQHFLKLTDRCSHLGVEIVLLKGKQTKKAREDVMLALRSPDPLIVVGTHALVQDTVDISNLGMVVVDEQHRFGVFQRQKLLEKSTKVPHCLFMSATPIPRTLMLTHYGDLDHDVIDELPPGRKSPKTYYSKLNRIQQVYEFIRLELQAKRQAYVVYPLIEASDHLDAVAPAVEGFDTLADVFSEFRVGLLHGKMLNQDKQEVMRRFKANEIQVLVSTTVIEVGVDVPNASTMVIMNAERFGLSQLHQLRGRVGRGHDQAHCFLVAEAKSAESKQRIKAMQASSNGFDLAEEDLKIRGPGNLLGTQQSGDLAFSFADLSNKLLIQRVILLCDQIITDSDQFSDIIDFFKAKITVSAVLLN